MGGGYSIEKASFAQLKAIPAIELAAASVFPEADLPGKLRFMITPREVLVEAQRAGRIWIALARDRQAVGFALADIVDGNAHLDEMDVHPDHARRGLGTGLLRTVVSWARAKGHSQLSLITFRHLPWNAAFYEKFGFSAFTAEQQGPELESLLAEEQNVGLNIHNRVAMRIGL